MRTAALLRPLFVVAFVLCAASCDRDAAEVKADARPWTPGMNTPPPAAEPPQDSWIAIESAEGRFTQKFPRAPKTERAMVPTAIGEIPQTTIAAEVEGAYYAATFADYPASLVAQTTPEAQLDGARDGSVANVGGKLVSERHITLEGFPGRELTVSVHAEGQSIEMLQRLYVVKERLYQQIVVYPVGQTPEAARFFDGFTLAR